VQTTGFVGGAVSYVGDREGNFNNSALRQDYPAYSKVDLRAGIKRDSWTINAYATNVTNRLGVINGGVGYIPPYAFVYIQPRAVGLNVSKAF